MLLQAIQQRDPLLCRRLVQQWVHRRGLASFQEFQTTTLETVAGSEARLWLEALLDPSSTGAPQAQPGLGIDVPLQQVEAAFAALAAEFVAPAPLPAPVPASTLSSVEPPPLSFAIAAPSTTEGAPLPVGIHEAETITLSESITEAETITEAEGIPQVDDITQAEDGELPAPRFPVPGRLPRLGRLKRLVRGCYEGAIGGFQAIRAGEELLEPVEPGDPIGISEPDAAITASEPMSLPPFIEEPAAPVEPVAPLPDFHAPGIAVFKDAPLTQPAATDQSLAEAKRKTPSLAFRIPRLGNAGPSQRPAPAPDALADLRAWLPDEDDDLPRAC